MKDKSTEKKQNKDDSNKKEPNAKNKKPLTRKRSNPKKPSNKRFWAIIVFIIIIATLFSASYFILLDQQNDNNGQDSNGLQPSEDLKDSIISGADFLVRMQNPNGSYKYKYYPESDSYSTANNILRHTGVVYSLLLVYEFTQDTKYLQSAESGIEFLMNYIEYIDDDTAYVFFNNKAKLGGAALAVIALAKLESLEQTTKYIDTIKDLTNFLLYMQGDSGKFTSFYIYKGEYTSPSDSNIYPGEAALALIRAYGLFNDQEYLNAMDKFYNHYVNYFTENPRTEFTTWTSTAFVELYNVVPEKKYADFVFQMEDWLVAKQYLDEVGDPRYLGGYGPDEPTVSAGSRTEGVADAYLLAKKLNDEERTEQYKKSMILAVNFLTQLQFTEELASIHPDPDEAVGAFIHHFGSDTARVDYTQHCISAMVKVLTYV
jgi:prenyltransferase beta subunit